MRKTDGFHNIFALIYLILKMHPFTESEQAHALAPI